ncbi:hypothetical protein BDV12DRAFT_204054 [Aspergillus spectabilis]
MLAEDADGSRVAGFVCGLSSPEAVPMTVEELKEPVPTLIEPVFVANSGRTSFGKAGAGSINTDRFSADRANAGRPSFDRASLSKVMPSDTVAGGSTSSSESAFDGITSILGNAQPPSTTTLLIPVIIGGSTTSTESVFVLDGMTLILGETLTSQPPATTSLPRPVITASLSAISFEFEGTMPFIYAWETKPSPPHQTDVTNRIDSLKGKMDDTINKMAETPHMDVVPRRSGVCLVVS